MSDGNAEIVRRALQHVRQGTAHHLEAVGVFANEPARRAMALRASGDEDCART